MNWLTSSTDLHGIADELERVVAGEHGEEVGERRERIHLRRGGVPLVSSNQEDNLGDDCIEDTLEKHER